MPRKIVVYGGAFNPPHIGHAAAIETTLRLFDCDEFWMMPSADRRDKNICVPGKDRMKMCELMIQELFPSVHMPITISSLEINRGRETVTYETKQEIESKYPDAEFYFLIGSENLPDIIPKWVRGRELYQSARFLIKKRHINDSFEKLPPHAKVLDEEAVIIDVSSTFVRQLLSIGMSAMPYITPAVAAYIKERRLYQ
ncbi:nicotinate (nicotinamide) nucleotide adenylyltransferase [Candidatus Jorgensenbacteria bacterium]|nr:nicotinate (nicotinamide) nucleotide adenylyltransferase [Candidatus Jorgensenbacteria bacterium]